PCAGVPWIAVGDPVLLPSVQDKGLAICMQAGPEPAAENSEAGGGIIDVMRCKSLVLSAAVVGAGSLPGPAGAEPACYELDPAHTTVAFLVEHAGFAKALGRFLDVRGRYTFDAEASALSDVRVVVDTA